MHENIICPTKISFAQQKSKWLGPWQSGQQQEHIRSLHYITVSGWAALSHHTMCIKTPYLYIKE